jgi:CBS domain containing-hemolysin-like protein
LALTSLAILINLLLRPFSWLLLLVVGPATDAQRQLNAVTEDELKSWVEDVDGESSLEKGERKMIYDIFQFSDRLCREIMIPRIDMVALDVNTSLDEASEVVTRHGHSRIPVYEDSIDNVLGLLYAKDLLRAGIEEGPTSVRDLLRPAYFIPEAKKVDELLREMQMRRIHMALVVDEYGGLAGLVTLEDIVEEIVGEIRDEFDQTEELLYQTFGTDEVVFHGRIDLDDFNEVLGTQLVKDVADTLGGFIYGQIGRVPTVGEQLKVGNWTLTVEQVSGQRIRKVRAQRHMQPDQIEENPENVE